MYKYYFANKTPYKNVNTLWNEHFQALMDEQFLNASDVFTVSEETIIGSNIYEDVVVRINRGTVVSTGQKLGDDFKLILFQDITHASQVGIKYYFDDNYWLVVNTDTLKTLGATCLVRRCNNILRWVDSQGNLYSEPCAIDYEIAFPRDKVSRDNPVLPGGSLDTYCQQNVRTNTIEENTRFLFGNSQNRVAYKVFGAGLRNFLNTKTEDDTSASILMLRMGVDQINDSVDDIANGIADRYANHNMLSSGSVVSPYTIFVNPSTINIIEDETVNYTVEYYSGSVVQSGSFVFSISGSAVPADNYTFAVIDDNNFSITNHERWFYDTLDIVASGSSGSRIINLNLRGNW